MTDIFIYFFLMNEHLVRVDSKTLKCEYVNKPVDIMEYKYPDPWVYWKCLDVIREYTSLIEQPLNVPPIPYEETVVKVEPKRKKELVVKVPVTSE